jgi:glycosyltransferase involved in cell wall biosynthesis
MIKHKLVTDQKKILFVMSQILSGGMELQIFEILRLLDRSLFEPFICTVDYPTSGTLKAFTLKATAQDIALREAYESLSTHIYDLSPLSVYDPRGVVQVLNVIRDCKPDLLYINTVMRAQIAGILARIPIVQHVRAEIGALDAPKFSSLANRYTSRFSRLIITGSEAVKVQAEKAWRLDRSKIRVVQSGVDISKFNPNQSKAPLELKQHLGFKVDDKVVITVGNARPVKGYHYFLQLASIISNDRTDVGFVLVGDGPSLPELETQASKLGLQDKVLFLHRRTDIPQLLAMADVFVSTSLNEASPNSVKEAMAMELPVVVTTVGGVPEIVENCFNGFLTPPASPLPMAEKVNWLLNNPDQARAFGRRGRETVCKQFTNVRMVFGVQQTFKDVLGLK